MKPALELEPGRKLVRAVLMDFVRGQSSQLELSPDLNWQWLTSFCSRHRLGPIFKTALAGSGLPAPVFELWKAHEQDSFVRNARASAAVVRIFQILEREAIPACALRGIVLAQTVYPHPSLRPMRDVDLLIRAGDAEKIERVLARERLYPAERLRSQLVYHVFDTIFEVHYSFLTPKRYRFKVAGDDFIASRQAYTVPEGLIYRLPAELELLGVLTHAFIHHELENMLYLVDAALIIRRHQINWRFIADFGARAGVSKIVLFSLAFLNDLFHLELESALAEFQTPYARKVSRYFPAYYAQLLDADRPGAYLRRKQNQLAVAETAGTRLRQALRLFAGDELQKFRQSFRSGRRQADERHQQADRPGMVG